METRTSVILEQHDESSVLIHPVKCVLYNNTIIHHVDEKILLHNETIGQQSQDNFLDTSGQSVASQETSTCLEMLCRICANSHNHLVPIFEGEGVQHNLVEKIHKYLPIQVSVDETLPLQLCYHCAVTIVAWHDIVEGCLAAQEKLLQMQAKIYDIPNESDVVIPSQHDMIVKDVAEDAAEEGIAESLMNKNEEHSREEIDLMNTDRLEFHNVYHEYLPTENSDVNKTDRSSPVSEFVKDLSQSTFTQQHRTSSTSSENEEPPPKFRKPSAKRKKEPKPKPKLFYCKFCGKRFKEREVYESHVQAHEGEKLFTCHVCGKQFGQTGSLYYHLKHVHEGVKNHACDICGRCFAMKSAMQDHRRIHTGERPYICDVCGKTYKTKAALYIHSKTHSDQFPYKCSYCGKLFKFKQQMLGHMTMHTGIKNHTCDTCGRSFGVKYDLTRHLRIHSTEKPFHCDQCGLSFAQKRYLKSHERTKHKME